MTAWADWFEATHLAERIFIFIAAPATLIMLIQTVMLFLGAGDGPGDTGMDSDTSGIGDGEADIDFDIDGDSDGSFDSSGLQFLTMRGVIAFLTVAGWTGALCMEMGLPVIVAGMLAIICGFGAMIGIAALVRVLMSLQASGNISYRAALGALAEVYLTIPGGNATGKVSVTLGGALTECDAITEADGPIRTGAIVRVTDVVRGSVLVVEQIKEENRNQN
ncbi:MAG: hypothetical protein LBS19_10140 [Clostridiales bacterium]|jgi:hypothetical protein|nr:hypothetical protein [Clostridiales bacterium]